MCRGMCAHVEVRVVPRVVGVQGLEVESLTAWDLPKSDELVISGFHDLPISPPLILTQIRLKAQATPPGFLGYHWPPCLTYIGSWD